MRPLGHQSASIIVRKKVGKAKVPHHIRLRDGELFAFAGLWEEWETPDGESLRTWSKLPISQGASTLNNAWK